MYDLTTLQIANIAAVDDRNASRATNPRSIRAAWTIVKVAAHAASIQGISRGKTTPIQVIEIVSGQLSNQSRSYQ